MAGAEVARAGEDAAAAGGADKATAAQAIVDVSKVIDSGK